MLTGHGPCTLNGVVFVKPQTASGKTFTMEGPDIDDRDLRGITPRVVDTVFEKIDASPPTLDFTLKVSMVEIYLEKLRDLLDSTRDSLEVGAMSNVTAVVAGGGFDFNRGLALCRGARVHVWSPPPAQIREHKDSGIYVEGMSEHFVTSAEAVYDTIRQGSLNRATASTNMNRDSSRSHSVFILTLVQKNLETLTCTTGKLYLVDLAGSEKVRKTGASGILVRRC